MCLKVISLGSAAPLSAQLFLYCPAVFTLTQVWHTLKLFLFVKTDFLVFKFTLGKRMKWQGVKFKWVVMHRLCWWAQKNFPVCCAEQAHLDLNEDEEGYPALTTQHLWSSQGHSSSCEHRSPSTCCSHTHTQPIRRKPTQREGGLKGKEINCYFQTSDKGKHKRDTFIILKCDYAKLL